MFSFDLYQHTDLKVWLEIEKKLNDEYQIPDKNFLYTLDPNFDDQLIETKEWLLPKNQENNISILKNLPKDYLIPDLILLKKLFDEY